MAEILGQDLEELMQMVNNCSPFYRDTNMEMDIVEKYQIGIIFQDPTFCDATYHRGGLLASNRFLIISANARCIDAYSENPQWGLCLWADAPYFKVIDNIVERNYSQITLLEIPEKFLPLFRDNTFEVIEKQFAEKAEQDFREALELEPLPELNNADWLDRLIFPLGLDDNMNFIKKYSS